MTETAGAEEFVPLLSRVYRTPVPKLYLNNMGCRLNAAARIALGVDDGGAIAVGVKSTGLIRLRAVDADHPEACPLNPGGEFGRLHVWARTWGAAVGHYVAEARDGALYVQLRREDTDGNQ